MLSRSVGSVVYRWLAGGFLLSALGSTPGLAGTELRSGPRQVAMVELFTSQGCSSCPPADEWLSDLIDHDGLWTEYVPLAFHVDYWDSIGWKDRFASQAHSLRQRRYELEGGVEFLYTPGFLVSGREWRQWRTATEPARSVVETGRLSVTVESGRSIIEFSPSDIGSGKFVATIATLGFGLESDIGSGENYGRHLKNDFVVLGFNRALMLEDGGDYRTHLDVPTSDLMTARRAVAIWISRPDSQVPLQATGGWYPVVP